VNALRRTLAITVKELRQLRRDRLTFGMIVGIPALQVLLFGFAINQDVRHLRAGVADLSGSQLGRFFVADAQASQVVDVVRRAASAEELELLLRRGEISVGIVLPHDFVRRVLEARRRSPTGERSRALPRPPAQLLVDGTDPIVLATARRLLEQPLPGRREVDPSASARSFALRAYYNPERRSAVQIVPALIGVILTLTMVLFTAVAIVRERERGNLELLITTPVRTVELMAGKILPYIAIGMVQVTIILLLGMWVFRVPVRGPLLDLYLGSLTFVAASLGMGLLISTAAQNQFQAMQMTFFFFLPSILLSGFMFPFEGMPEAARWIGEVLPLTHFVRIVRGIVLRGADLADVSDQIWPLLAFFAVTMTLAVARFRKRLD
jgi:ABC-2 type transport system permease protein